jgi:transcriptional regulator with XRE-family HTH domain
MAALATHRRRRFWSQRDLAQKAGVAVGTIVGLERGQTQHPRLKVMRQIAAALGVEPLEVDEFRRAIGEPLDAGRIKAAA